MQAPSGTEGVPNHNRIAMYCCICDFRISSIIILFFVLPIRIQVLSARAPADVPQSALSINQDHGLCADEGACREDDHCCVLVHFLCSCEVKFLCKNKMGSCT